MEGEFTPKNALGNLTFMQEGKLVSCMFGIQVNSVVEWLDLSGERMEGKHSWRAFLDKN